MVSTGLSPEKGGSIGCFLINERSEYLESIRVSSLCCGNEVVDTELEPAYRLS